MRTISLGGQRMLVLTACADALAPLPIRYACLVTAGIADSTPDARAISERLRVPADCAELALLTAREHENVHASAQLDEAGLLSLLERSDAFRRPERFLQMLVACECDAIGRLGLEVRPYPQRARLAAALKIAQEVDTRSVSTRAIEQGLKGPAIADAIRLARIKALAANLASN
ncbi:hypothetical protein [Scleromatobacter humisilvae]|uniref:Multifunctional CCA protein n=1 Tax=Scleromatobacter humisilvae TaxID=2897159 RepID=A0A9X1YJE1_9BURK|nr:hypothetical protein [Scleromatobacter humisilvae]MCK9685477.1 hypothetical protein [Scleromatobacter humisilvae]